MVLPDEAGLSKSGTRSLFSQPDPPGLSGKGNQDLGFKVKSLDRRSGELGCGWLQAGRRDGVWGMCFSEEGTGPNEDGTLDRGVSVHRA